MSDSDANGASSIPSHELELGGNSGERERAADGYRQSGVACQVSVELALL